MSVAAYTWDFCHWGPVWGTGSNVCGCMSEVPSLTINNGLAVTLLPVAEVTTDVTPEATLAVKSTSTHLEGPEW
jgi:hypothetical protein